MNRAFALLPAAIAALLIASPSAHAAAPSCQRDGATLLAASAGLRVVSIAEKHGRGETRHDHIYGCLTSNGKRFTLFNSVDHGLDEIQRDTYTLIQGRYVGVATEFEGGVSESFTAASYDVKGRKKLHDADACDSFDDGVVSGVREVVFFKNGGMAYSCGQLRIADGHGDRALEPAGTDVSELAVAGGGFDSGQRLYWTVTAASVETLKSLDL
jgi:hypothetical protein